MKTFCVNTSARSNTRVIQANRVSQLLIFVDVYKRERKRSSTSAAPPEQTSFERAQHKAKNVGRQKREN